MTSKSSLPYNPNIIFGSLISIPLTQASSTSSNTSVATMQTSSGYGAENDWISLKSEVSVTSCYDLSLILMPRPNFTIINMCELLRHWYCYYCVQLLLWLCGNDGVNVIFLCRYCERRTA